MGKNKVEQAETVDTKAAGSQSSQAVAVLTERSWVKKNMRIILAVGLLFVAVLLGGAVWYSQSKANNNANPTEAINIKKFQNAQANTDKLRGSQDYDAAKKVWQSYVDANATDEEKYKAYLQIGALDETKGDYKAALKTYYMAEKLGDKKWRAENEAIARCSEKLGDLQTSLKYYQRTLDTFPGGEEYDSDLRYYRDKIDSLKRALEAKQNG